MIENIYVYLHLVGLGIIKLTYKGIYEYYNFRGTSPRVVMFNLKYHINFRGFCAF